MEQLLKKAFNIGKKFIAFMKCDAVVEVLEGTMASGKTTVGKIKFILKVMKSKYPNHFISGRDIGTIERNIIKSNLGILHIFGKLVKYNSKGAGEFSVPHLVVKSPLGDKYVLLFGYYNEDSYLKLRGGRYGCGFIDECNYAKTTFVIEGVARCDDYCLMTLNPDDPNKEIYKQYINKCRPLKEWEYDTPQEILNQLTEQHKKGWVHWFFRFTDNVSLSEEQIDKMVSSVAPNTKQYKSLVQGLRCKATGLVFPQFGEKQIKQVGDLKDVEFILFSSGLDTAYSSSSPDTVCMSWIGIDKERRLWVLDENVLNNKGRDIPFAPSDIAKWYIEFLDKNKKKYGNIKNVYVDSADKATYQEINKYLRENKRVGDYIINNSYKKFGILDRINAAGGWMQTGYYFVLEHCKEHIRELQNYSWEEDKINTPCDFDNHTIDSISYAYIPYVNKIGIKL